MSISSVSSVTNQYPASGSTSASQRLKDLQSLGQALQSGDLASAQSALATFQQNLQGLTQPSSSQNPFGVNGAAGKDVQSIQSSLQSGDLAGAQKAFTQLKTDLRAGHHARGAGGHHRSPQVNKSTSDGDSDDSTSTTSSTDTTNSTSVSGTSSTTLADALMKIIGGVINQQA